jgi:hypothetical protein
MKKLYCIKYISETYVTLKRARFIPASLAMAASMTLLHQGATAAVTLSLGAASDFAVLAGAGITVAGAVNSTLITGDIGSYATTSITGLENTTLFGINHAGDAVTQQGKLALGAAYTSAFELTPTVTFTPIYDLNGLTLAGGVYNAPSSLWLTGILTLDAGGDPDAVWVFQAGSTLITGTGSNVILAGGANTNNIFWQVGSSATLGTGSIFEGTIMASQSITLDTGAVLNGRALAQSGAVTMDYNTVTIPETSSVLLSGLGLISLLTIRRRSVAC